MTSLHFVLRADGRTRDRCGRLAVVRGQKPADRMFRLAPLDHRLELLDHPDVLGEGEAAGA